MCVIPSALTRVATRPVSSKLLKISNLFLNSPEPAERKKLNIFQQYLDDLKCKSAKILE